MSNTNTNTAATTEISAEDRLAAKRAEEKALRAQLREAKVREGRLAKLRAYQAGEISDANPKGHHNPSLLPETLRKANEDEQIGKSHSHGWVVQIQCPTCSERVWINTQDAFQKTHCNEHAKAARRAANKDKRKAKALPDQVSAAEAKVAELKAQLAALQAG